MEADGIRVGPGDYWSTRSQSKHSSHPRSLYCAALYDVKQTLEDTALRNLNVPGSVSKEERRMVNSYGVNQYTFFYIECLKHSNIAEREYYINSYLCQDLECPKSL